MIKKLLLSVLAIFGFAFLIGENTFAASDVSFTVSSSQNNNFYVCPSSSVPSCENWRYIYVSSVTGYSTPGFFPLSIYFGDNSVYLGYLEGFVSPIPSSNYSDVRFPLNSQLSSFFRSNPDIVITYTLSDFPPSSGIIPSGTLNITENGTFDVTSYASAVVDVPQTVEGEGSFIVNLFKGGFWNVSTAIVGLIVPVLALFLVFRLIHGLIYGKGV